MSTHDSLLNAAAMALTSNAWLDPMKYACKFFTPSSIVISRADVVPFCSKRDCHLSRHRSLCLTHRRDSSSPGYQLPVDRMSLQTPPAGFSIVRRMGGNPGAKPVVNVVLPIFWESVCRIGIWVRSEDGGNLGTYMTLGMQKLKEEKR
ncbi:hypothetical protein K469DRAFT_156248 [Zopfia rhizophila CBS 207.26]|uniref:Uncharacterized protein n=1 Tax=Zopfia rhizophila CBS 207.26 TaxID=1314779 RepID=A0A6A6E1E4_9PEZI|nr:hypothetical protein K469DRAFT_156248 [Zopfia rhizophila CBS 207.26]